MPERETLTAKQLKRHLDRAKKRRGGLEKRLQQLEGWIKRAAKRLRRKRRREKRRSEGPKAAAKWALAQLGTAEKPDGSNWGVPVQDWIKYTGYSSPVPWCGCFVAVAAIREGGANIPARIRLGYHGYIIDDARNRRNGLRAVNFDEAKAGDIVAFDFAHIAMLRDSYDGSGTIETIEGNTSPTSGGSQNNGGTVAAKRRPVSDVAVIARPDY